MYFFSTFPATDCNMDWFSERLRQLREERSITQTRLAELVDVLPRVYNRWERGVSMPYLGTIVKIADILNVSLDELTVRCDSKDSHAEAKIRNPELHRLYQQVDQLSNEDQKALVILLDSLVKSSIVSRVMTA